MPDTGNASQTRIVAEQVAEATVTHFFRQHPELAPRPGADVPAPLKWAAVIISALLVMGVGGTATWLVTTVNEMQLTLARMDERQQSDSTSQDSRFGEINRRLGRLEQYHERGGA